MSFEGRAFSSRFPEKTLISRIIPGVAVMQIHPHGDEYWLNLYISSINYLRLYILLEMGIGHTLRFQVSSISVMSYSFHRCPPAFSDDTASHKIYFERPASDNGCRIPSDGVPFIITGWRTLECQHGAPRKETEKVLDNAEIHGNCMLNCQ